MKDTSPDIRKKQLEIWLAKSPGERLLQFIIDNDTMFTALNEFRKRQAEEKKKKLAGK